MKNFLRILKILVELGIFLVAVFIVFGIAYYFGWSLLVGLGNWGNDAPFAASYISYLARWYPPIPSWFYVWAGGMPFMGNYPFLPTLVTFFYHHLTGWSIQQVMRLFFWIAIPLAAAGVALLGRLISKSWWVGVLAGAMMLFSPDSWFWTTHGGFYAIALSAPIFAWTLVIYVLAFEKQKRFFWVASAVSYALTWLFHPVAGVLITLVFFVYGIGFSWQKKRGVLSGIIQSGLVILGGALSIAWWLIPFYILRQNQGIGVAPDQIAYVTFKELIGLEFAHDGVYLTSTLFTISVVILFFVGAIAAFLRRSIIRALVAVSLLAIFIMTAPGYVHWLAAKLIHFWEASGVRAGLILRILGPIIAAYGAVSLTRPIFWGIEKLILSLKQNWLWRTISAGIGGLVGVAVFFFLLKTVVVIPPMGQTWLYRGFGPMYRWIVIEEKNGELFALGKKLFPDFTEVTEVLTTGSIRVENWEWGELIREASRQIGLTDKDRVEIVPFSGAISGDLANKSDVSQIPAYVGANLIPRMIGWQVTCFYYGDFCGPTEVEDLARWFGISWVWLGGRGTVATENEEVISRIKQSGLFEFKQLNLLVDGIPYEWNVYQFLESTGLASITNKPAILVIGDNPPNNDVFDTLFRVLSKINFGYPDAWSVKGKRFIDDYQLEELDQFEIVVLYGYQYHHKKKAWDLLEKYVQRGGKLLVNTGWKYMNPDWGKEVEGKYVELEMPKIFPVTKTIWGNMGYQWDLKLPIHSVNEGVGNQNWGEPIWKGIPWEMATASQSWLREEATPLLINQDKILVASMNYGQGRVVWAGFDLWGHFYEYEVPDEKQFLKNLFSFLSERSEIWEEKLDFTRQEPDLIKIDFNQPGERRKLMFKETASQNWKAVLISTGRKQKLSIFKAGPGWKMVFLPNDTNSGEVVFSYKKVWYEWLGIMISVLIGIGLVLYLVGVSGEGKFGLGGRVKVFLGQKFKSFKKQWESEEY